MGSDDFFHKRKVRQARDLSRQKAKRAPYDRALIVCEGERTEPNYFEELVDHYRLNSANVMITGECGSSPMSVVNHARQLYREAKDEGNSFDQVYCVIDRDDHPDYQKALDAVAKQNTFMPVISIPCFEYWLLLHFVYTDKPFHASGSKSVSAMVLKELKQYWPEYQKSMSGVFMRRIGQLEFAKKNAIRALRSAHSRDFSNPSTNVHELVTYLQKLKSKPEDS